LPDCSKLTDCLDRVCPQRIGCIACDFRIRIEAIVRRRCRRSDIRRYKGIARTQINRLYQLSFAAASTKALRFELSAHLKAPQTFNVVIQKYQSRLRPARGLAPIVVSGGIVMHRKKLLPTAIAAMFVLADFTAALALPAAPSATTKATVSTSDVQLVRGGRGFGGGRGIGGGGFRGAGFHGGARGYGGRGMVAHRGYGFRGGGMYAGRYGGRYAGGRYGYGRYGYGRGYGWGAAAAGLGVAAAATSPYWYGGYNSGYNCGPYQYYQPGYGCVNQ
jgi:hypothetical protein